jgi:F-type H+-transporting ATPase subunit b
MFQGFIQDHEFWVAIAFIIVVAGLVWKGGPIITGMLDDRSRKIKTEIDEAARLREEAQRVLADYQRKQRDALKEAEAIIAQARREAEEAAAHGARELAAALDRRQRLALEKIALAESKATAEVRNTAVDVAMAAVRRIAADALDPARKSKLIDDAIAGLPERLN